jgi:hypothetical protein
MRTDKQIEASRRNGKLSLGPVTADGRRNSAGNRLAHGFYARAILLDGESSRRFASLVDHLYNDHCPQTYTERLFVEKMAVAQWRQMRLWTYEKATLAREAEKQREAAGPAHPANFDSLAYHSLAAASLSQHEIRFERQFNRAYDRLTKSKVLIRSQQLTENKEESEK